MSTKISTKEKVATTFLATLAGVSALPVYADVDFGKTIKNVLNAIFGVLTAAGVIFIVLGVVGVFRSVSNPDQGDPHALGKGLGFLVGGIVMVSVKSVLKAIGVDVDSMDFGLGISG